MRQVTKPAILMALLAALPLEAQVAAASGSPAMGGEPSTGPTANALILGTSTGVVYDSNALGSQPPISDVQYTLYPLVGLDLARPRWHVLITFVPGLSYSSVNLAEYQMLSLRSDVHLQYRPSERWSVEFTNYLVSSSNPFDSLSSTSGTGPPGNITGTAANLNYPPKTNELMTTEVAYSLSARTSLKMQALYNYLDYQNNPNVPSATQLFKQSSSAQVSIGISHGLSPRYSETVQYVGQLVDSGQGRVKTIGQSFQYGLIYSPTRTLQISAAAGPEYLQTSYSGTNRGDLTDLNLDLAHLGSSEWTWAGNFAIGKTFGDNRISASASRQPGAGNQYQGVVQQTSLGADFTRPTVAKAVLILFGSYNLSKPIVLGQNISRLSNNYFSSGVTISKKLAERWVVSCSYWYLFQKPPSTDGQIYSGNHNRVAISLSYAVTRPLKQ